MIKALEELLMKLFGAQNHAPIPVRIEKDRRPDMFSRPAGGRD